MVLGERSSHDAGAPGADVVAQWRESAARAASRAYEAAYGREIPDESRSTRWSVSGATAAVVAIAIVVVGVIGVSLNGAWPGAALSGAAPSATSTSGAHVQDDAGSDAAGTVPTDPAHASAVDTAVPGDGAAPSRADGGAPMLVQVSGAVAQPGLVEVPPGSRVADAVDAAGGLTESADLAGVNLARPAADGEHVHVPTAGESQAGEGPVSINTAPAAELEELPGVGPVLAARIVADREANGPFASLDDAQRVSGVGPALVASWDGLAVV